MDNFSGIEDSANSQCARNKLPWKNRRHPAEQESQEAAVSRSPAIIECRGYEINRSITKFNESISSHPNHYQLFYSAAFSQAHAGRGRVFGRSWPLRSVLSSRERKHYLAHGYAHGRLVRGPLVHPQAEMCCRRRHELYPRLASLQILRVTGRSSALGSSSAVWIAGDAPLLRRLVNILLDNTL